MLAADYPFLDVMFTMLVFFVWILWFWLLFAVWSDIFRRHDLSGGGKAGWLIFTIVLPFLGVFVYLIMESKGMTERTVERSRAQQQQVDEYVRTTAAGSDPAGQIAQAKELLDNGTLTQAEFDAIKQKALA